MESGCLKECSGVSLNGIECLSKELDYISTSLNVTPGIYETAFFSFVPDFYQR